MSKEVKPAADEAAAPKKSKKLLIIIVAAVVLLAVAGGAAFFLLGNKADHGDDEEEVTQQKAKPAKKKKAEKVAPPVYVALEPFTVNLASEQGEQFLQIALSLEVEDMAAGDGMKLYMPKLRNSVMLLLSGKKAGELLSMEGKQKLAGEIRDRINEIINPPAKGKTADGPVMEVLFTSFIIQ